MATSEQPDRQEEEGGLTLAARLPVRKILWALLEVAVVVACASLVFAQRLIDLEMIEIGGDALTVWEFARHLALGSDSLGPMNHHTSRFGLVLPSVFVQWVLGSEATSYYVGPLAASVLLHVLVYLIGRKLTGPIGGVVGALALLSFSPMERASSQILPETFGPMYVAFSVYAALWYNDAKTLAGRWFWLGAAGMGLVLAYGAKLVFLFYAPGVALLVWFGGSRGPLLPQRWVSAPDPGPDAALWERWGHRLRTSRLIVPAALTALVLLLVLVETVYLVGWADAGSRIDVVASSHGGGGRHGPRIREFSDFFTLYARAPSDWTQALAGGAVAWLGVIAFAFDRRAKLIAVSLFIYFFLQTFIIRRIDPLTLWFEPHPRYLLAFAAPLAVILGLFTGDALGRLLRRERAGESPEGPVRAVSLLTALALLGASSSGLSERYAKEWGKKDAWTRTELLAAELSEAYAAGVPIVSQSPGGKPVWAAAALFVDPHLLRSKQGGIVSTKKSTISFEGGKVMARSLAEGTMKKGKVRNVVAHRLRRRRCVVTLRQSVRFIVGNARVRDRCESMEEEMRKKPEVGKPPEKRSSRRNRRGRQRRR